MGTVFIEMNQEKTTLTIWSTLVVKEGRIASLTCSVLSNPASTLAWYNKDVKKQPVCIGCYNKEEDIKHFQELELFFLLQ